MKLNYLALGFESRSLRILHHLRLTYYIIKTSFLASWANKFVNSLLWILNERGISESVFAFVMAVCVFHHFKVVKFAFFASRKQLHRVCHLHLLKHRLQLSLHLFDLCYFLLIGCESDLFDHFLGRGTKKIVRALLCLNHTFWADDALSVQLFIFLLATAWVDLRRQAYSLFAWLKTMLDDLRQHLVVFQV